MSIGGEVFELAASVFGDAWEHAGDGFDAELWATCEQTGLARLMLTEDAGGSGGSVLDASDVLIAAGQFAARAPLLETNLLAGPMLHAAGIALPDGPLTAVLGARTTVDGRGSEVTVSGVLRGVPWGRAVSGIAVLADDRVLLVDPAQAEITERVNLAGEPRDDVRLVRSAAVAAAAPAGAVREFALRAALGRSLLLAGAARGALAMAVRYATERIQFGRPLSKLQAVQQQLALAAGETAAAVAAAQAAVLDAERIGYDGAWASIAAAKTRVGEAATEVARVSHQVHGALGFTLEHDLRKLTTRLWAWRDEDGPESIWAEHLGSYVLDAGADRLWPLLVDSADVPAGRPYVPSFARQDVGG